MKVLLIAFGLVIFINTQIFGAMSPPQSLLKCEASLEWHLGLTLRTTVELLPHSQLLFLNEAYDFQVMNVWHDQDSSLCRVQVLQDGDVASVDFPTEGPLRELRATFQGRDVTLECGHSKQPVKTLKDIAIDYPEISENCLKAAPSME